MAKGLSGRPLRKELLFLAASHIFCLFFFSSWSSDLMPCLRLELRPVDTERAGNEVLIGLVHDVVVVVVVVVVVYCCSTGIRGLSRKCQY